MFSLFFPVFSTGLLNQTQNTHTEALVHSLPVPIPFPVPVPVPDDRLTIVPGAYLLSQSLFIQLQGKES
ncbi:hypothetical protein M8C21_025211 [Ambrosia artemisiifolia]|uniref:Uncharacterized protein n=1 Tax=Ambrosia artemisiifolia TaxID=4212 RepID=A0AAD5BU03_AMBAR|nr:hypothetical protein M8C21_025211 [Ambrosia artemisiifolia]